jgi:hypothetical protein
MPSTDRPVFSLDLTDGAHHRRFAVERSPTLGWRVREEADEEVIRQVTFDDWHRVELAIRSFNVEAAALTRLGWHRN